MIAAIIGMVFVASAPAPGWAQSTAPGRLSGSQIVERWTGWKADGTDRTPAEILARQYVDGYLAGVADATHGTYWCNTHATKPHEVDAEVMWMIKDLSAQATRSVAAAKLVIAALSKRFPCEEVKP